MFVFSRHFYRITAISFAYRLILPLRGETMRITIIFVASLFLLSIGNAQSSKNLNTWSSDDFKPPMKSTWIEAAGKWNINDDETVSCSGAQEKFGLINDQYFMRVKQYSIDVDVKRVGGGIVFGLENKNRLANAQVVYFNDASISVGYLDFSGNYVETRVIDFTLERSGATVEIIASPKSRNFTVTIQGKDIAREEMRFLSGYVGLFSMKSGAQFDNFFIGGEGLPDAPAYFVKSNQRQLDQLSYMAMSGDALLIVNPVIGIVQHLTSNGNFVSEISLLDANKNLRGICSDEDKWVYVVDAAINAVRLYNREDKLEHSFSTELNDPRGVAAGGGSVYILDADGIKVFSKKGDFIGAKAANLFKDPKNIYYEAGNLYVADFGNGQVQVLDASSFSVKLVITDQLQRPFDVSTDPKTHDIYVADPGAGKVFRYNDRGKMEEQLEPITIRGFISPRAVRIRGEAVYVGDYDRILVFKKGVQAIRPLRYIYSTK
jgi:hypothetical protein